MNSQGAGSQADWTFLSLEDGAVNLASGEIERKGFFFLYLALTSITMLGAENVFSTRN